jgi:hypothetical protein
LRALGLQVEIHADHFAPEAQDVEWLESVGQRAWVVVTKDERILRDPAECRALRAAGVHAVFFGRQKISAEEMLADFEAVAPKLVARFSQARKPTYVVIRKGGRMETLKLSDV